jgi:hypothetical protein
MGYLDPGLFGVISQVGLVVLLAVVSLFMFFLNPIKKFFNKGNKKSDVVEEASVTEDSENKS